jgi:8-oxo-dGTP diphosphatase
MDNLNPQVILPNRYMFVCRSLILLIKDQKVLLLKGASTKKIWPGKYNGLGGHIESGENVLDSAKRELQEEAGIQCPDLTLRGMVTIEVKLDQGILMFVFSGNSYLGNLKNSEEGSLEWVDFESLKRIPVVEDVPLLVDMIEKEKQIFYGHYSYDQSGKLIHKFMN